jgi:hypothetical protein
LLLIAIPKHCYCVNAARCGKRKTFIKALKMKNSKKQTFGNTRYGVTDVIAQGNLFADKCKNAEMRDVLGADVLYYGCAVSFAGNGGELAEAMRNELKQMHGINADELCVFDLVATFVAREDSKYAKQIYMQLLEVTEAMANKKVSTAAKL